MRYIHDKPTKTHSKVTIALWALVAVTCAVEIALMAYLATNHTPAAVEAQNGSNSVLSTGWADNTNITEPFDIQAAGGYKILMEEL